MSLTITKGYLIDRKNINTFDEIITFINEHGLKFVCFSAGSKKIKSKNARNLVFGSWTEFEFFYSQTKMSRLKKATILSDFNLEFTNKMSFFVLNELYSLLEIDEKWYFDFYQNILAYNSNKINDYLLILFIIINIYKKSGIVIDFKRCVKCNSFHNIKTVDIDHNGVICSACFDSMSNYTYNIASLKLWALIQNTDTDLFEIALIPVKDMIRLIKTIHKFIYEKLGIFLESIQLLY